jgi:septal ring-binding cell division protein DamX
MSEQNEVILDGVGAVEQKQEAMTKNQKPYWKFVISGKTYSLFEHAAGVNIQVGMPVNLTWTETQGTGKTGSPITYRNLKSIYPADVNSIPETPQQAPAQPMATQTINKPQPAQGPTVDDYKKKEADKFELGMARNNAAILFSKMLEPCESVEQVKETLKAEADYYDGLVEALFKRGKAIREKILGY